MFTQRVSPRSQLGRVGEPIIVPSEETGPWKVGDAPRDKSELEFRLPQCCLSEGPAGHMLLETGICGRGAFSIVNYRCHLSHACVLSRFSRVLWTVD